MQKRLLLFGLMIILLSSFASSATWTYDNISLVYGASVDVSTIYGVKFKALNNVTLHNVTNYVSGGTLCDNVSLTSSSRTWIKSVANTASGISQDFDYNLTKDTEYYFFWAKAGGGACRAWYSVNPNNMSNSLQTWRNINFTYTWDGGADRIINPTHIVAIYTENLTAGAPPGDTFYADFLTPPTPANDSTGINTYNQGILNISVLANFTNTSKYINTTINLYNSTFGLYATSTGSSLIYNYSFTGLLNGIYWYNATININATASVSTITRKFNSTSPLLSYYVEQPTQYTLGTSVLVIPTNTTYGTKFKASFNITIVNATKISNDESDRCYITNSTHPYTMLYKGVFTGNTCPIFFNATANVSYYLMVNKSTYGYNVSYGGVVPSNASVINFTNSWDGENDQVTNPTTFTSVGIMYQVYVLPDYVYAPSVAYYNVTPYGSISSTFLMTNSLYVWYNYSTINLSLTSMRIEKAIIMKYGTCVNFVNGTCMRLNNTYENKTAFNYSIVGNSTLVGFSYGENNIYPVTENLNGTVMGLDDGTTLFTNNNQMEKDELINVSADKPFGVYELMINRTTGSGNMTLYYCNNSYVSGNPSANTNCVEIFNGAQTVYNHSHSALLKHNIFPFRVVDGKVNSLIPVTSKSYFISKGNGYTFHMAGVEARPSVLEYSASNGVTWSNEAGFTGKSHLHQFTGEEYIRYRAYGNYTGYGYFTTEFNTTYVNIQYLPPTIPTIITPIDTTILSRYMFINWTNSSVNDLTTNISYYLVEILNNDTTLNTTILRTPKYLNTTIYTRTTTGYVLYNITPSTTITHSTGQFTHTFTGTSATTQMFLYFTDGTNQFVTDTGNTGSRTYVFNITEGKTIQNYSLNIQGSTGETHVVTNVTFYSPEWNNRSSYNMDVFSYNLTVNEYKVRVTAYDTNGGFASDTHAFYLERDAELVLRLFDGNNVSTVLTNYNLNVTNVVSGASQIFSVTTDNFTVGISKTYPHRVYIDEPNYALYEENISGFSLMNTINYINFSLYKTNSVAINIYDEETVLLIRENVTIDFKLLNITVDTRYVINGTLFVQSLSPGFYTITFDSASYDARDYTLTMLNRSTQTLNAYLVNSSNSGDVGIFIKDIYEQPLTGATLTLQQSINGSYVTVATKTSDGIGFLLLNVIFSNTYRIVLQANGFTTRQFDIQFYAPNSPYSFKLVPSITVMYIPYNEFMQYFYTPTNLTIRNVSSQEFTFNTHSNTSRIIYFGLRYNTTLIDNVSGSPTGGTARFNMSLGTYSGALPITYFFRVDNYSDMSFTINYFVENRIPYSNNITGTIDRLTDNTSKGWQAIIGMFIILGACATIVQISGNPVATTIVAFLGLIFFAWVGWFNPVMVGFILVIGVGLFFFTGGRD